MIDEILDMNDPDFAEKLAKAIGANAGDTVQITGPQFERTDGIKPALPQIPFNDLHKLDDNTLKQIGCQKWNDPTEEDDEFNGKILWLYPADWYDYIPNGTKVVDINNETELFESGKTDDDRRFGALSFGFTKRTNQ